MAPCSHAGGCFNFSVELRGRGARRHGAPRIAAAPAWINSRLPPLYPADLALNLTLQSLRKIQAKSARKSALRFYLQNKKKRRLNGTGALRFDKLKRRIYVLDGGSRFQTHLVNIAHSVLIIGDIIGFNNVAVSAHFACFAFIYV